MHCSVEDFFAQAPHLPCLLLFSFWPSLSEVATANHLPPSNPVTWIHFLIRVSLWGRMQTATSRRMSTEEAFSWSPKCTWPMLRDRCGCFSKITVWMCFFKFQAGLLHRPHTQEQDGDVGLEVFFFFFHTQIRGNCELLLNWTLSVLCGLQNVQSA